MNYLLSNEILSIYENSSRKQKIEYAEISHL